MFYFLSKLFWFVAAPLNLLGFLLAAIAIALGAGLARLAHRFLAVIAGLYLLIAFGPLATLAMRPLEDRFPRPAADMPAPDGIIVLGGAMDEYVSDARGALVLNDSGTRMTEGAALARRFPEARVIFTGGSGSLNPSALSEAEEARRLFLALGVGPERMVLEDKSRNTFENAIFTRDIVKPRPEQRFLLVTSGFHIPRAMGVFRRAGFNVVAWPADYRTSGLSSDYLTIQRNADDQFRELNFALKEWVGLIAYRAAGMTDALFPGP